ncbi:MAG: DUF1566 domain-containing protein [Candidatus Electrothrix aestuarii]|uniref:DUF1566 domain-containing protein n=1 Tax=Candidatus Electrothrix aestuarii TaxID=3062594 RepID=A0AAU8LRX0_9BACT
MRKIILLASLVAGGVAFSATAYANNWLLYLPAILAGSGGTTTTTPTTPTTDTTNKWLLLFLPAILSGAQNNTTVVIETELNDTGIITSVGTKDDAFYGRDANTNTDEDGHAGFSFTVLTGGCIQDNVTGLIWSPDQGDAVIWQGTDELEGADDLVSTANGNQLCGKTDWRLPEVGELLGIISYDAASYTAGKTVDTTYFTDTQVKNSTELAGWYWAATPANGDKQWGVTFQTIYNGTTQSISLSNTLSTSDLDVNFVRLVSGTVKASDFTPQGDGSTVLDNNTGLIWQRCLEGQTFSNGSCTGTATGKTWTGALDLDDGTWRVPNVKELQSLVGEETYFPTPATSEPVWSSSPFAGNTQNSWGIDFSSGLLFNIVPQSTPIYVRLVRDAPAE